MINTKQLQSNKESTDRWWLSGKKQKQNSCRTDSDHDEEKQGQWDKGEGSLGTDPNTLINILWLPIFYSPSLNYGEQQESKCPNFDSKKKMKSQIEASCGAEEAAKFKGSSNWFHRFKERHNIVLRRRTNMKKVGADDGRDTIQKFHRDLRKALKTQRRRNKSYTVDPNYGRWIPKNRYNIDPLGSCPICKWVR